MILIIRKITDAMVAETRLPHRRSRFQTKRESSFNELHSPLQRNLRRKRQPVHVIRHDDEFMQKIFPFISIVSQGIDQKTGDGVAPENWLAMSRNRSDKEYPVGVHFEMVVGMVELCL